jgi:hypothetical protein
MRTVITLIVQELFRPRRSDPLEFVGAAQPVLTPAETRDLLDQMDGDLWRKVCQGPLPHGAGKRTDLEALNFLAPRRRPARRVTGNVRDVAAVVVTALVTVVAAALLGPMLLVAFGPFLYELGV